MQRSRRISVTGLMVAGLLLLQAAWILVMPPFGAADEFDHAYRASAAAHGEIFTDLGRPPDGRGLLVTVNDGIAEAARAQCEVLEYPGPDNCVPVASAGDGMVTIASAAAIYQPTYYLAVGWVTHFTDGFSGLYAMRIVSALLCASLWGLAVWVITGWARSRWPLVVAAAALTPTTLYSLAVLAPNGVEMALALALWACLIGTTRTQGHDHRRRLIVLAIPLACAFAWIRPFSPVWLFLILASWLVLLGATGIRDTARRNPRLMGVAVVLVGAAALTSTHWVLSHSSGEPAGVFDIDGSRWGETLDEVPLWFLQVISGVPFRNSPATFDVYLTGLVLFTFVLIPLLRCRTPRVRTAALLTLLTAIAVAVWYTYSRLPSAGALWQGRYAWCLALGVVLMAGLALEDRKLQVTKTVGVVFGLPCLVIMHLRCLQFVLRLENGESPLRGGDWVSAPLAVVLGLAAAGLGVWVAGAWLSGPAVDPELAQAEAEATPEARLDAPMSPTSGRD